MTDDDQYSGPAAADARIERIRRAFPALQRVHNGQPVAYFDGPGGTQVPASVAEAMTRYLLEHNANTHWAYPSSEETDAMISDARGSVAAMLNAAPSEVVFGANMTTLTFHLARALGRTWLPGDEVVITELDHHANVAPWKALEVDRGIVVRTARMTAEAALDLEHLSQLIKPRTKLVAVGGASNAVGTINDVRHVVELAKRVGALVFVDAVHLAPHALLDVQSLGCDFLACSAYKFYGPHVGILWARDEILASLPFPKVAPAPDEAPERAETGTQNHEGIAGVAAAIEFLASTGRGRGSSLRERLADGFDAIHADGSILVRQLWDGLSSISRVRLYGLQPGQPRTPTVAFTVEGRTTEEVARHLASRGVFASDGNFYAATLIERLGVPGVVRAGCACYTTIEEVNRLVSAVEEIA